MRCISCGEEIESDDNFCPKCGHWTAKGYGFLKDKKNIDMITHGSVFKQNDRFIYLTSSFFVLLLIFFAFLIIRGDDLFRPIAYLKKQVLSYRYGYNATLIKTDNKYSNTDVLNYDGAINYITKDFNEQSYLCNKDIDLYRIEYSLTENYSIQSVTLCDMSLTEANKIKDVIDRIYILFPNIKGALTNITISNASNNEYIARFQPMYQFVNIDEDIFEFNKVNKTQILLNSYYFLNEDILSKPVEDIVGTNWYVTDATWESTIAHELGHYISFVTLLHENNISNITLETKDNYKVINSIINEFDSGTYSLEIVNEALNNYNAKYLTNINLEEFALSISGYAGAKDKNGNIIADEVIAEAVHDYYLHGENMKTSSSEIIKIILRKLGEV